MLLLLLLAWVICDSRGLHAIMALYITVCCFELILAKGTVTRLLVACLVEYECVSELYVSWLNRPFLVLNTFIFLTKTRSDADNLSSTLRQEGQHAFSWHELYVNNKVQDVLLCFGPPVASFSMYFFAAPKHNLCVYVCLWFNPIHVSGHS